MPLQEKKGTLYDPSGIKISDYSRIRIFSNSVSFKGNIKKNDLLENHIYSIKIDHTSFLFIIKINLEKLKNGFLFPLRKLKI